MPKTLRLVARGDASQCVLEHAVQLRAGKTVPLTLTSHAGCAIGPLGDLYQRELFPLVDFWTAGVVSSVVSWSANFDGNFIAVAPPDSGEEMVFNIAMGRLLKGNDISLLRARYLSGEKTRVADTEYGKVSFRFVSYAHS
mgnify:CR=1 FL=1